MKPFRLSVVIPCYNEEKTLRKCVESVLLAFEAVQDVDLELIIVDDCSRDRSLEVATELANQHPGIIVQKHERNQGKGAALRTEIGRAHV